MGTRLRHTANVKRLAIAAVVGLVIGLLGVAIAAVALRPEDPGGPERFAVEWRWIAISEDRRTISVETHYPLAGFCAKEPAGVTVQVRGSTARIGAWVGEQGGRGDVCTMECGAVRQTITLKHALPESVRLEPVVGAVRGCG